MIMPDSITLFRRFHPVMRQTIRFNGEFAALSKEL